ncbi:hypothetical protein O988_00326 [Pseudogymnoascus sp. VKM F-3808]|nr:hypothetical protein O988_00326 [Pseudogymnoascus sp. VKM F-3808]
MVASPVSSIPPGTKDDIIGEAAEEVAKRVTAQWHRDLRYIFDSKVIEDATFVKKTCSTPTGFPEWEKEPRVAVIG